MFAVKVLQENVSVYLLTNVKLIHLNGILKIKCIITKLYTLNNTNLRYISRIDQLEKLF